MFLNAEVSARGPVPLELGAVCSVGQPAPTGEAPAGSCAVGRVVLSVLPSHLGFFEEQQVQVYYASLSTCV